MDKEKKPKYIQEINSFFNIRYKKYKNNIKSLGWSEEGQEIRFKIFSELTSLNNKKILDIGSGFGDFAHYLIKKYPDIKYTGYDINENFINNSKTSKNISFENRNILINPPKEKFDIIFSIGSLNSKFEENEETMKKMIKAIYDNCNEMAAISMTSTYVDKEYIGSDMHYYNPSKIFSFAKTLTKNVDLIHSYLPHDFTIVLYKKNDIK